MDHPNTPRENTTKKSLDLAFCHLSHFCRDHHCAVYLADLG